MSMAYNYLCIFQKYIWILHIYEDAISGSMKDPCVGDPETYTTEVALLEIKIQEVQTQN